MIWAMVLLPILLLLMGLPIFVGADGVGVGGADLGHGSADRA